MAKKQVSMLVTVSCPEWLTAAQARTEVRTRINELCTYGFRKPGSIFEECEPQTLRAKKIAPATN